ncbi:MAG: rhomboid family intramembrane serine protease [Flavobacteriales bacterium]|nr:rhomboid family intramembrane serine protease [Flavobacteriales bacterium]
MELTQTPITLALLVLTVLVSWQAWNNSNLFERLLCSPYRITQNREYYRVLTHGLIHANGPHLIFNMLGLFMFGQNVEAIFTYGNESNPELIGWSKVSGMLFFFLLYAGGVAIATLPSLRKHRDNPMYRSVGASGGVSAILMAYAIIFPMQKLTLIIFPFFGLPAFIWIFIFFAMEHYMAKRGGTNIAHDAHIWGGVFGIVFVLFINPQFAVMFAQQVREYFS